MITTRKKSKHKKTHKTLKRYNKRNCLIHSKKRKTSKKQEGGYNCKEVELGGNMEDITLIETQKGNHCGKHAINNLLQGDYIQAVENPPKYLSTDFGKYGISHDKDSKRRVYPWEDLNDDEVTKILEKLGYTTVNFGYSKPYNLLNRKISNYEILNEVKENMLANIGFIGFITNDSKARDGPILTSHWIAWILKRTDNNLTWYKVDSRLDTPKDNKGVICKYEFEEGLNTITRMQYRLGVIGPKPQPPPPQLLPAARTPPLKPPRPPPKQQVLLPPQPEPPIPKWGDICDESYNKKVATVNINNKKSFFICKKGLSIGPRAVKSNLGGTGVLGSRFFKKLNKLHSKCTKQNCWRQLSSWNKFWCLSKKNGKTIIKPRCKMT